MSKPTNILKIGLVLVWCFCESVASAATTLRVVAVTGVQAPNLQNGVLLSSFESPEISADGNVVFVAMLEGTGVSASNDESIWTDRSGDLEMYLRNSQQIPGAMMVYYGNFIAPIINDDNKIATAANLEGTGVDFNNDQSIFTEGADGVHILLAREGDQGAGVANGIDYGFIQNLVYNNDGRTGFAGVVKGSGIDDSNNAAIWVGTQGGISLVARDGTHVFGMPVGVNYDFAGGDRQFALAANDHIGFLARVTGTGITMDNDLVIIGGTIFATDPVLQENDQLPDGPAGVLINGFGASVRINDMGQRAFLATLRGAGVTPDNQFAILSEGSGVLSLVARMGDQATGLPAGVTYSALDRFVINNLGDTFFNTKLDGNGIDDTNDEAILVDRAGDTFPVVQEGEQAPGTGDDVVFGNAPATNSFESICANRLGQVIFQGQLTGPGVTTDNDFGVWIWNEISGAKLVVREGEEIEIEAGDARTVETIDFWGHSGGADGRQSSLSENGELALLLRFTDGSHAIVVAVDTDGDGTLDALDNCPNTVNVSQADADGDGVGDACDNCENDANKTQPGACGCGTSDEDSDGDGAPDCLDQCPNDAGKLSPGACGCGQPDVDSDGDLILDCNDNEPDNPNPGQTDGDGDGVGDTPPDAAECCGGGMPAMMPFMLLGWRHRRKRRRR